MKPTLLCTAACKPVLPESRDNCPPVPGKGTCTQWELNQCSQDGCERAEKGHHEQTHPWPPAARAWNSRPHPGGCCEFAMAPAGSHTPPCCRHTSGPLGRGNNNQNWKWSNNVAEAASTHSTSLTRPEHKWVPLFPATSRDPSDLYLELGTRIGVPTGRRDSDKLQNC